MKMNKEEKDEDVVMEFTIRHQWLKFLARAGVKEGQMSKIQENEMKKAFYGACGQLLVMLRDDITDIPEEEGMKYLENMIFEVSDFWKEELEKWQDESANSA